jgi:glycosyltransferase involved in cell wall biosynthesis
VAPGEVGLTAIQSLSFGVPVITHGDFSNQMPEAESVVHGITGWLFEKNSVDGLRLAMEAALSADIDVMRPACFGMVDNFFNPRKQVQVIARASLGLPAMENDWTVFLDSIQNETLATDTN